MTTAAEATAANGAAQLLLHLFEDLLTHVACHCHDEALLPAGGVKQDGCHVLRPQVKRDAHLAAQV
jgi:hypothetical protein